MTLMETETRQDVPAPPQARLARDFPHHAMAVIIRHRFYLALSFVLLALIIITEQVVVMGPLVSVDYAIHNFRFDLRYPQFYDVLFYLVMIGQRGPTAIVALMIAGVLARKRGTWRPVLLVGFAVLALNGVVGTAKLAIGRALPADNTAAVFVSHGIIFPSGHASNVVVAWGIAAYLLTRYGPVRRYDAGIVITMAASLVVGIGSIYLDTHWTTDILAGWLSGVAILMITVHLDQRFPVVRAKHRSISENRPIPAHRQSTQDTHTARP